MDSALHARETGDVTRTVRTLPKPTVHAPGDRRLDAVLDFVAFAAKPMPLSTLLDGAPARIASILEADVCSLYFIEGDGTELVMRGNVGFTHTALGQVRLRVGQGITGEAVEYLRPISAASADEHAAYKHFAELGEERFPVFLAAPLRGKSGPLGAIVVQRREVAFDGGDVELLSVIGAVIAAGVRHQELIDSRREKQPRRAGGGTRKVTLTGRPLIPGRTLGAVAALRRPPPRPSEQMPTAQAATADVRLMRGAFDVADKAIDALRARAKRLHLGSEAAFLDTYSEILGDMRFRQRASEIAEQGVGLAQAFGQVAREATRNAVSYNRDPYLEERARDLEDLCDALTMLASAGDKRAALPTKAIMLGDSITVFDLLVTSRAQPVGIALSERASGPRTRALLELMGVPAVVDVQGLFRWASDGDIALLDGDHGLFIINPSKSEMASLREYKRARALADYMDAQDDEPPPR
jgi:phosphotransferase system enzyme I (PtsP)